MRPDFQEIVLSARQDEFFHKNMYANFGDLGEAMKASGCMLLPLALACLTPVLIAREWWI